MNTDFSSLRCPSCSIERPGYLAPSEPLDHTKSWQCDVCKKTEPAQYVSAVIRSIGEELVCLYSMIERVISSELTLKKGWVILANEGHSQY